MDKGALALLIHGGTENWSPERWKRRFGRSLNRLGSQVGRVARGVSAAGLGGGRVGAVPLLLGEARGRSEAQPTAWSFPVRAHVRRAQRVAYARTA